MRDCIRHRIDQHVLYLYENALVGVSFPVQPLAVLMKLRNCRYISYRKLATETGKSVAELSRALGSPDGCTTYDGKNFRYLVAINPEGRSRARVRWTTAHELGHIAAGHFAELASDGRPLASPSELEYMEEEADYFAASFLAPLAAVRMLRPKSAANIRDWFDLSQTAAEYRWAEYLRNREPTVMDEHFRVFRPHSAVLDGRLQCARPADIWPDSAEMELM